MKIRRGLPILVWALTATLVVAGPALASPGAAEAAPAANAGSAAAPPAGATPAQTAAAAAVTLPPTSNRPPKELKFVNGHWTAWDPPQVPDGATPYIVAPGDTLWALSGKFNNDPMLWPLLWDGNRYIQDTHWIYPGDPLNIPAAPTVVPPGRIPVAAGQEPMEEEAAPAASAAADTTPMLPQPAALADTQDLYCSDYIDAEYRKPVLRIVEAEEGFKVALGPGEVVYLNEGAEQKVAPGDEFDIIHPAHDVRIPTSDRSIGTLIERRGRLKVLAVQPHTATAMITFSCAEINAGDRLLPRWDPEVPMGFAADVGAYERYGGTPSGKPSGLVIATPYDVVAAGQGHIVQVTLGQEAGLKPGDRLLVYRPNRAGPEYERKTLGVAMVVTTQPRTAAVKLMETNREVYVGDLVEIQ